ncbi:MAG: hypothetical protein K1X57_13785, partial [Gemmataceae bacterium]|nr:hypothetical protein [Gemmataceae bacterium]
GSFGGPGGAGSNADGNTGDNGETNGTFAGGGGGGGSGGAHGVGGVGGDGGDGGAGGAGGSGAGGAGGSTTTTSSAAAAFGASINVSAGTGGTPSNGRFILAANSGKVAGSVTGAQVNVNTIGTGVTSVNVHVSGFPQVPNIPNLLSGSTKVGEAYGRTSLTANDFTLSPTGNQGLAVVLLSAGPGGYNDVFAGFSYLFFINTSTKLGSSFALDAPQLSIGTGTTVPLQNGGWLSSATFGGTGNTVIPSLAPGEVYATLVANGQSNVNISVSRGGNVTTQQINGGATLPLGTVFLVDTPLAETPSLVVDTTSDVVSNTDFKTSLREAIAFAATKAGPDTITFSSLFNSANTITLSGSQLTINDTTDALTIQGPGANRLSINADQKSRVFGVAVGTVVTLNGLTITGGNSGAGGGIINSGTLTINDSAITGNTSSSFGGGIESYGALTVNRSTISNNVAGTNGGIDVFNGSLFLMINTTVTGNSAGGGTGGVYTNIGSFFTHCTIVGNIGAGTGGLRTTVTSNVGNSLVAGNTGPVADVQGTILAITSLIGNSAGATLAGGSNGNLLDVAPLVGPLGNYGGTTLTIPLLPGSPAINAGTLALSSDQRDLPRFLAADIGAFESQFFKLSLSGSGQSTPINTAFPTPLKATVIPLNPGEPVDGGVLTFVAPVSGASASLSASTVTIAGGAASVTATANATLGKYEVTVQAKGVETGNFSLSNAEAQSLIVNTDADAVSNDGKTSLREAIVFANTKSGADTITFDPTVFATAKTIVFSISNGELSISDAVTITGPTARVTVDANKTGRVFNTSPALAGAAITMTGLIITGGQVTGSGGGIFVGEEALTLVDCVVAGNSATIVGGGVHVQSTGAGTPAALILRNTSITGNVGQRGAGVYLFDGGSALIEASTISGNVAQFQGGGFYFYGQVTAGGLTVRNSTIANNTAGDTGGGIILRGSTSAGTLVVQNSTITGNSANTKGGGIYRLNNAMVIALESSIVSGNVNAAAPDIFSAGTVTMKTSAVGSNTGFAMTDQGGNLAFGADLKLGSLASNGGPTQTIALLSGSPAINAGSNPAALATDQRGLGFNRSVGQTDMGAFELQSSIAPAKVQSISINGGATQRSRVTTMSITFDQNVGTPSAAAFQLQNQKSLLLPTLAAAVDNSGPTTVVTLTFSGSSTESASLADGRYTLTISAGAVNGGNFDGNGDGTAGDNYSLVGNPATNKLFRLFGDADGSGQVTSSDFLAFRLAFLSPSTAFDFNGNGMVDSSDFLQFRLRFLQSV